MAGAEGHGSDRLGRLRGELRALGYLESRLERYLLRDLFTRPGLATPALVESLRAAALGGGALGLALCTALALGHAGLRARPGDLLVLWLWSTLLTSLVVLVAYLGCALCGLTLGVRPQRLARGLTLGLWLLLLGWLVPWSLRHAGDSHPAVALALTAIAALLAARLGGLTALHGRLDRLAGGAGQLERGQEWRRTRRGALGIALVALAVAVGGRPPRDPASPVLAASPAGRRVILIGIDGLVEADLAGGLGAGSRALAVLAEQGASYALEPGSVPVPPVVWTTIATGRDALHHGVQSLLVERLPGVATAFPGRFGRDALRTVLRTLSPAPAPQAPLSEGLRREKALWEVASDAGSEVVVVNWWATYPAGELDGVVISDRAYASLCAGRALGREVHPPELGQALSAAFARERREPAEPRAAFVFASDRFHAAAALERAEASSPRLVSLYLQSLDVWAASGLREAGREGEYGAWLAGVLERARGWAGAEGVLMLVGHPGRAREGERGLVVLAGGPVRRAGRLLPRLARLDDIAPTVLLLAGLPESRELPGRALQESLEPPFSGPRPFGEVASYGRRVRGAGSAADPTDAEALERLRSLGYVN